MSDVRRAERLRHQLVGVLEATRRIRSPEWSRAWRVVPRHIFVPEFETFRTSTWFSEGQGGWLEAVYSDDALIISRAEDGANLSSSSGPGIMADMLELLCVEDCCQVLEVGTGSGYNCALLCERLGAQHVTSIDVDEGLVEAARSRLADCGYTPRLATGDGAEGWPDAAPYDRLICTCAVWPVPTEWLGQVKVRGRIVAPLGDTGGVALDVQPDGSAVGRYDAGAWYFMNMRVAGETPWADASDQQRRSLRYPAHIIDAGGMEQSFAVLVDVLVGSWTKHKAEGFDWILIGDRGGGAWASVNVERSEVIQAGSRRLWDEVEALYERWCRLGAPNRGRFGLTVQPDGTHTLWLDDPTSEHCWDATPKRAGHGDM